MGAFEASDIVEFAIRIEENGANFYRFAVQIAKDESTKKLFEQLATAEDYHKKTFEKIFAAMDKAAPPEGYPGEYAAYLHNYVDNAIIFKKEALDQELARVKDTASALDFAIQREMDSILYYHEIKGMVPTHEHGTVDKIIEEERRHLTMLSVMKKQQYGC
ncbi:MAG: ferritin family protein [Deltaproteobacteria bacterium]|jgi:rubrerythrin|nr:ferritin family protein [Deltaproteobacteria bacterium]